MSNLKVSEPIPISKIAGRYLLFDIDVVTHLRRVHNICGVLIGGIPQVPQQNVFNGLPVQLSPEEARLLVEKNVAYIVDDFEFHKEKFSTFSGADKKAYLNSLREGGRTAQKLALAEAQKRSKIGLAKQAMMSKAKKTKSQEESEKAMEPAESILLGDDENCRSASPSPSTVSSSTLISFTITPTTTPLPAIMPTEPVQEVISVPESYPLFAYLHSHKYFITPGLRFGCDYTVYPGDPLRFHSHFLAAGQHWHQEIPMMDLIGGGRLGTGVKKGYLIGGKDSNATAMEAGEGVRTFCIEWGGM